MTRRASSEPVRLGAMIGWIVQNVGTYTQPPTFWTLLALPENVGTTSIAADFLRHPPGESVTSASMTSPIRPSFSRHMAREDFRKILYAASLAVTRQACERFMLRWRKRCAAPT